MKGLMVNAIVEYADEGPWMPYLVLGAGYADVSINRVSSAGTDVTASSVQRGFACQVGTGRGWEYSSGITSPSISATAASEPSVRV